MSNRHRLRCVNDWLRPQRDVLPTRTWTAAKLARVLELASEIKEYTPRLDDALRAEIDRAKQMVESADVDDEDFSEISREALDRAIEFLRAQSAKFRKTLGKFAPVPKIGPGPNGSVDLHWKRDNWELLVNISADVSRLASFYGDDYGAQKIKGSFDPKSSNNGIIMWLTNS